MSKNTIVLPNGRRTSVSRYVAAWHALKAMPASATVPGFDHFPAPASDILGSMRAGLHDRINRHDVAFGKGRKWDADWQRAALQTAGRVNTPRLIIDWLPPDFKARFAHRLRSYDA